MAESVWNWITVFFLFAVIAFIIMFAYYKQGTGLFTKVTNDVFQLQNRFFPIEPAKELKQDERLPQRVIDLQDNIARILRSNIGQQESGKICRIQMPSLSSLEDFGVELSNLDNNVNVKAIKIKSSEGNVFLNKLTIANARVCLINAENFYNCYVDSSRNCGSQLYSSADSVTIKNDGSIANQIIKFESNQFCFVPLHGSWFTKRGCDASSKSLDRNCVDDITREIPICGTATNSAVTDKDKPSVEEFDKFISFLQDIKSTNYNKLCTKTFVFNTKNIGPKYYIYSNPNGQAELRFNEGAGRIVKSITIGYIPLEIISDESSAKELFDNYDILKHTFIISPAGDYSISDKSIKAVLETSIVAVNSEGKWILSTPNQFISKQPTCA